MPAPNKPAFRSPLRRASEDNNVLQVSTAAKKLRKELEQFAYGDGQSQVRDARQAAQSARALLALSKRPYSRIKDAAESIAKALETAASGLDTAVRSAVNQEAAKTLLKSVIEQSTTDLIKNGWDYLAEPAIVCICPECQ